MTRPGTLAAAAFAALTLLCGGCHSGDAPARSLSSLSAAEHREVIELLKHIYEAGVGQHVVAWYNTTARGYYDVSTGELVSFDEPIQTLSVAIPDVVAFTTDVENKLEAAAASASHKGWRLAEFHVQLEPQGAGGGPSGRYDKLTIYPVTVTRSNPSPGGPEAPPPTATATGQSETDGSTSGDKENATRSACDTLADNIRTSGSKHEGLARTLQEIDGNELVGCEM